MAYAFSNQYSLLGTAGTTVAISSVVLTTGQNVIVPVGWHASSGPVITLNSVSDGTNTYTRIGSSIVDANADGWGMFYCPNVTGGTYTVTATFSGTGSADPPLMFITLYTGLDPTNIPTTFYENTQATPTTGTDAVTTGLMTVSNQPAMIYGVGIDLQHGFQNMFSGTGFTGRGYGAGSLADCLTEDARVTATSSKAATFTTDINDGRTSMGAVFVEPLSAGVPLAMFANRRNQLFPI